MVMRGEFWWQWHLLLLLLLATFCFTAAAADEDRVDDRPNFIVFLTDDQDSLLGSLDVMPHLRRHLTSKGMEMQRAFVTTPVCCPSRSSLLTGLYAHNHHTLTNNANCSSPYWRRRHEPMTFGKQLNDAGYRTAYVGKYLNKYDGRYVPPGWDRWLGQVRNSRFYNYSVNDDEIVRQHGWNYARDYFTDLATNRSLDILQDWNRHSLAATERERQPFLLVLSYPAPHGPEDSAPQHQALFANDSRHRTASYNLAPNLDKEWLLRRTEPMPSLHVRFTDLLQQKRLQTLQSVDDGVRRVMEWLDASLLSDSTYVFYTSDHGYHLGQFGLLKGKSTPYEFDIRVPLIVRGPGVPAGAVNLRPVLNIDLAPTLLDLAGVTPARPMDGDSFAPLLLPLSSSNGTSNRSSNSAVESDSGNASSEAPLRWRRSFLVQRGRMTPRKLVLRRQLETARNFDEASRRCSLNDLHTLSCDLGDRWHCVPSASQPGQHDRVKCPGAKVAHCRCRRSLVLPISRHVWQHCWRQQPDEGSRVAEDGAADDGEAHDDAAEADADAKIQCRYSSLSEWLRDRRMMRLSQRKLDSIQGQLNKMRQAMRQNKAVLMRLRGCKCRGGRGGDSGSGSSSVLTSHLEELPRDDAAASIASLLRRKRRRRRGGKRAGGECNLKFMNCFRHDRGHWRTPPLWSDASICFCGNASNYTYWCMRTVEEDAATVAAESLYCEFVTGFISYYNMTLDPHQLVNRAVDLSFRERAELHARLNRLRACSGAAECSEAGA